MPQPCVLPTTIFSRARVLCTQLFVLVETFCKRFLSCKTPPPHTHTPVPFLWSLLQTKNSQQKGEAQIVVKRRISFPRMTLCVFKEKTKFPCHSGPGHTEGGRGGPPPGPGTLQHVCRIHWMGLRLFLCTHTHQMRCGAPCPGGWGTLSALWIQKTFSDWTGHHWMGQLGISRGVPNLSVIFY